MHRKKFTKMNFEEHFIISKMYIMYLEYKQQKNHSWSYYTTVQKECLNPEFNIVFCKPKKEPSDSCTGYMMASKMDKFKSKNSERTSKMENATNLKIK